MKYAAILVLLLGFTAPLHAGELDGRGVWCPDNSWPKSSKGYWFQDGRVQQWHLLDVEVTNVVLDVAVDSNTVYMGPDVKRLDPHTLFSDQNRAPSVLNRRTLKIVNGPQCFLVSSKEELIDNLQAISEAARAGNKL